MRWLQNVRIFLHAAFGLSQDYFGVAEQKRIFPEPTDAAGWASRAFRASQSCEKALHQALRCVLSAFHRAHGMGQMGLMGSDGSHLCT